jgi:hypothetical protein
MASSLSAWQLEEEHGLVGLFALKVVTKVRAARSALRCALCLVPVYQLHKPSLNSFPSLPGAVPSHPIAAGTLQQV